MAFHRSGTPGHIALESTTYPIPAKEGEMKRLSLMFLAGLSLAMAGGWAGAAGKGGMDTAKKIRSASSAAPMAVSKDATIMDWPSTPDGKLVTLREGTNGWTCLPDTPSSPGPDPMCLDKQWMKWLNAYMSKTVPAIDGVGIAYMLQPGSYASNSDPFAGKPAPGEQWIKAPPHIMVLTPGKIDPAMFSSDPHSGAHWIMWGGTPYEHLMIPVK